MENKEFTAYCSLYCDDCIPFNQPLFNAAEKLREELDEGHFDKYAELKSRKNKVLNDYQIFKKVLSELIKLKCGKTCTSGGGNPSCRIRDCVCKKGIKGCWECLGFEDCQLLEPLSIYHGDTPECNLRLIKEYGIENWTGRRGKHYIFD